jgi:hypothetical protein
MEKEQIIEEIKGIIENYGSFGSDEVEQAGGSYSPCVNEMGNLVALAECFNSTAIAVNIYDPTSFSSDPIDDYDLTYEELDKDTLEQILFIAELFETDQEKTLKRISN